MMRVPSVALVRQLLEHYVPAERTERDGVYERSTADLGLVGLDALSFVNDLSNVLQVPVPTVAESSPTVSELVLAFVRQSGRED